MTLSGENGIVSEQDQKIPPSPGTSQIAGFEESARSRSEKKEIYLTIIHRSGGEYIPPFTDTEVNNSSVLVYTKLVNGQDQTVSFF